MSSTPFCMVSRSESAEKRCGNHESTAMLAMIRGPARKPLWEATKSSRASEMSTRITKIRPGQVEPKWRPATKASASAAFMVLPCCGKTLSNR